jgi:site-specific DNA recombinase
MTKRKAILYLRVSTDEQAEKGYSLKHQDDRLRQYCDFQNIEIVALFKDDYSAKTFERPQFKKLIEFIKGNRNAADLLLFLKWDRFSRNIAEAYAMINRLNRFGVEPQAIEQPLDLNIPENKIMLAFYLAATEVENDRRSLNTIAGMRRAMKEGRHVNMAPKGYRNVRNEFNKPIIEPSNDAPIVTWIFEEIARGVYNVMEIWRMAKEKGLKIGKSQMWTMVRNPVYCGKIYIAAYKDEEEKLVSATHDALISEDLFADVQDVLHGRKRKGPVKNTMKEELPLRGHLVCKKCGNKLTGSASKGNGGRYFYYHCSKGCNERFKAKEANETFTHFLEEISYRKASIQVFQESIKTYAKVDDDNKSKQGKLLQLEIIKHKERIDNAQQMMLDGQLEPSDYRDVKNRYTNLIEGLERKQRDIKDIDANLYEMVDFSAKLLSNLPKHFTGVDLKGKQQIIGSIFPERLVFQENKYRTIRENEVVKLMCYPSKPSSKKDKKITPDNGGNSTVVPRTGFEPAHPCERCHLKAVRLPISPSGLFC